MSGLVISITAIGQADSDQIIYRNGARPGDLIVTTGDLGGAYFGLQLLEREKQIFLENPDIQPDLEEQDYLVGRLLKPEARKDIIEQYRVKNIKPTSMIDIRDRKSTRLNSSH